MILDNDLISIVVPLYNVEDYLKECIDSILIQSYHNLEIILVDDGSTDNSGKICDDYAKKDSRIKVIHKENGGASDARNYGIKEAKGKYIQFTDSDDFLDKDMIKTLYIDIKENNSDVSICSMYWLKDNVKYTDATYKKMTLSSDEAVKEILLDKNIRSYSFNKLYKKSLFDNIKYPKGRLIEDLLVIPKVFLHSSKISIIDIPLYYYRQRSGSILHNKTKESEFSYLDAVEEISNEIRRADPKFENYCDYAIANSILNTYNDIAYNKMEELFNEERILKCYETLLKIFEKEEGFIIANSTNIKKMHYYYLLTDRERYLKDNRNLLLLYPEN